MKTYTITYNDGQTIQSGQVPCPERLPEAGDVYEFTTSSYTLGEYSFSIGDRLEVLQRTQRAPHHRLSSLGNLLVRSKHNVSVWTNLEWAVAEGRLRLVSGA